MKKIIILVMVCMLSGLCGCERYQAKKEAEAILTLANQKAALIIKEAEKAVIKEAKKKEYDYLKSRLIGLKEYPGDGVWIKSKKYLEQFKVDNYNHVIYRLYNTNEYGQVKPDFTITFYDRSGVTTGYIKVFWLFDKVESRTRREEKERMRGQVSLNKTKYYKVSW